MTPAEFAHLIETHGISLQRAIDWRASIDSPEIFAWGPTALAAVERLATKAGWLSAGPLPLFEQEGSDGR